MLVPVNLVDPDASVASVPAQGRNAPYVEPRAPPEPLLEQDDVDDPISRWPAIRRIAANIAAGAVAGSLAVVVRLLIGLPPDVLPFFLVVIAVCLVTVAAGFMGGLAAMLTGAFLTWRYLLSSDGSFHIGGADGYAMLGFFSVGIVILVTSQMYRWSEQRRQTVALELALRDAQHQRLFAREMSHRLKNAMSIVQAIASQTFSRDIPEVPKFEGRLKALADAHNLLNEHVKQPTASVAEVVETAIDPFLDRADRFRISGAPIPLPDQQVVTLSLALHELGTNAVKYGALGHADGWVAISWTDADGWLELEWKEHDGPPVAAPLQTGFGSRLLARSAMGATMIFEADGLKCTIRSRLNAAA